MIPAEQVKNLILNLDSFNLHGRNRLRKPECSLQMYSLFLKIHHQHIFVNHLRSGELEIYHAMIFGHITVNHKCHFDQLFIYSIHLQFSDQRAITVLLVVHYQ